MDNPVYKLLIVEDDLGIAQAIQTQASMWNFDVRIVEIFVMSLVKLLHFLRISFCSTSHFHFLMATTGAARLENFHVCQLFLSLLPQTT